MRRQREMPAVLVIATRILKDYANEIEKGAHEHRAVVIIEAIFLL